jgi:hypothetical protein
VPKKYSRSYEDAQDNLQDGFILILKNRNNTGKALLKAGPKSNYKQCITKVERNFDMGSRDEHISG